MGKMGLLFQLKIFWVHMGVLHGEGNFEKYSDNSRDVFGSFH